MGSFSPVNLNIRTAYYLQVKAQLQEKINLACFKPGDKLPSEASLCESFKVSRTVIRQALMEMEYEGQVQKRKGKGTFVCDSSGRMVIGEFRPSPAAVIGDPLAGFTTKVIFNKVEHASALVATALDIEPGMPVLHVERLRFNDSQAIRLIRHYFSLIHCAPLLTFDFSRPVHNALRDEYNTIIDFGQRTIESTGASDEIAGLFGVPAGTPMLTMTSINYLANKVPIEYSEVLSPGDMFRIEFGYFHYANSNWSSFSVPKNNYQ